MPLRQPRHAFPALLQLLLMSKPTRHILAVLLALCALSPRAAAAGLTREPTGHLGATDSAPHNAIDHAASFSNAPTIGSVLRCAESRLNNHVALFQNAEAISYARNNPVNFVDPNGTNAILIGRETARTKSFGHADLLLQNGSGEWFLFSQWHDQQRGDASTAELILGKSDRAAADMLRLPLQDGAVPTRDQAIEIVRSIVGRDNITSLVEIHTTAEQDQHIYENAMRSRMEHNSGSKQYNLYSNNCLVACQDVVTSGTGVNLPGRSGPSPSSYMKELERRASTTPDLSVIRPNMSVDLRPSDDNLNMSLSRP